MADMGKIGAGQAHGDAQTVGTWKGTPKDANEEADVADGYVSGNNFGIKNPINMSNHKRSPLS